MKLHPLTIILIGFFILSLVFNYGQFIQNKRLKKELQNSKSKVIFFPMPQKQMPKFKKDFLT